MSVSVGVLLRGAVWTIGGFAGGQVIRFATNIVLTRLLAPELFGLMLIVNTIRIGFELFSDLGIGQNIVYSKNAENPEFYNTAWSLQLLRSLVLWLAILISSPLIARYYNLPILRPLLPIAGLVTIIYGLLSVSIKLLEKRLAFAKLNVYRLVMSVVSSIILIAFAYVNRTIWALVFGVVLGEAVTMIGSHFLLPEIRPRFQLRKRFVSEIIHFGKWISLSSIVYFLSLNFDRLYFAKVVPLEILGVYGIARSISDLVNVTALQLGNQVVFPFVASHWDTPRATLRDGLVSIRGRFLWLAALGCSLLVATADLAIKLVYDERYQSAGWMLPVLLIGSWFSLLASLNESTLLGLGAPSYMAISNGLKFVLLLVGVPPSFGTFGFVGALMALSVIEVCRYVTIYIGQKRQNFSFGAQDLRTTLAMFLMIGLWEWLRWISGLGTSFDSLPLKELLRAGV